VARTGADGSWWRATRTPLGPATARYAGTRDGVEVNAWGPGAPWIADTAPDLPERPSSSYRNMERAGFQVAYRRANWVYPDPGPS
jgi:hypothetical protein